MRVLEDEQQGLTPTFPEEQALDGVEGSLAPLQGAERLPLRIGDGEVEQGEQRRQYGDQAFVQRPQLLRDLLSHFVWIFPSVDLKVALEELDYGQVRGRVCQRNGGGFQEPPVTAALRGVRELPGETRFAHTWLADQGHELPAPLQG